MRLTFIVTIDPVKGHSLLNAPIHAFNLQTCRDFDVVFYNQTRLSESELFAELETRPRFDYRWFSIDRSQFLADYPLWDLYTFHRMLLDEDLVGDYFMCMHMEEWPDVDYVENATKVLETTGLDVLLGNLSRTWLDERDVADIIRTRDANELRDYVHATGLTRAPHWTFQRLPSSPIAKASVIKQNCRKLVDFGFRPRLVPSRNGYSRLSDHYEDLYFMRRDFARRYDWFLSGRRMFFEDIQLCDIPGVCELGRELATLTEFPRYFNLGRMYHLRHPKYYYQLEDHEFTAALLALNTDDRLLLTLQDAVRMYRSGNVSLEAALRHTRRNADKTGSQNLNHAYHLQALARARSSNPSCEGGSGGIGRPGINQPPRRLE